MAFGLCSDLCVLTLYMTCTLYMYMRVVFGGSLVGDPASHARL